MNVSRALRLSLLLILFFQAGTRLVVSGQQTAPEILTLDQAIDLTLRDNRMVKNSQLAIAKVDDQLAATRTLRFPSFNLYALGSQQLAELSFEYERGAFGTYPGIGPIPNQKTLLTTPRRPTLFFLGTVTQPLSQQYRIRLSLDLLKVNREVAGEELRKQQQAVVDEVKHLYYGILQSQSALKSLEQSIRLFRELDRVTSQYVDQQVALKSQSLEVKTRLAKSEYDMLSVSSQLASQKEQLNNLLGRDIRTAFEVNAVVEPNIVETNLPAAQNRALEQRPEIKLARLKVRQADLDRRIKKSELIPDVSIGLNYLSPRNFNSFIPKNLLNVGLVFSWDVFDWGKRNREVAEKSKTSEQAQNALLETENKILIEVNSKFRNLQQAHQLLVVARLGQETAREKLRVAQNKYQVEAVLLSDVLQTQTSVAEADHQYQQSLLAFWAAKAEFEKALGESK
ncbi:MAG: TolC family protein [Pyrinomonadaceae bacterium]